MIKMFCNRLIVNSLCAHLGFMKGHALWHLLTGLNAFVGPCFIACVRARALGLDPKVQWLFYVVPVIEIHKIV
jgi:hypothetical protein